MSPQIKKASVRGKPRAIVQRILDGGDTVAIAAPRDATEWKK
ncbi:MAG TPA: hypothetical protein VNZ50_03695 [Hyphomicrobiaceae bacterium]|jgi:hypothetical protein|nr:hypothetical protein [Hyphomicrobiaceae bacterium]